MAQAMFQVTDSRRGYKNFLFAIIQFLHSEANEGEYYEVAPGSFVEFLQVLANERFNQLTSAYGLDTGTSVPRFVFNYLDFKLWWKYAVNGDDLPHGLDRKSVPAGAFRFRYRNSVEHFYPQSPPEAEDHFPLDKAVGDNFGNLCLMTNRENSSRNNLMPMAKITHYKTSNQGLKFMLMAALAGMRGTWGEAEIRHHRKDMLDVLDVATW
jgi:hypothetical protein